MVTAAPPCSNCLGVKSLAVSSLVNLRESASARPKLSPNHLDKAIVQGAILGIKDLPRPLESLVLTPVLIVRPPFRGRRARVFHHTPEAWGMSDEQWVKGEG